jgi:hypothetical protein
VTTAAGILALGTGLAYTFLGVIAIYELGRHGRSRGFSYLGGAFTLMAATCGPHHLVHAEHHLLQGEPASGPMFAALLVGFVPGAIFVLLRIEALAGGRGDRFIAGTPLLLSLLPWALAVGAGVITWAAIDGAQQRPDAWSLAGLIPNLFLLVNYAVVGALVGRTQVARRPGLGGWSVSGVAMSGVFFTCGLAHLVAGLAVQADWHVLLFDIAGVPFSFYFLWVVRSLHRHSLRDWNRRPLVGRASRQSRPSPWAQADST